MQYYLLMADDDTNELLAKRIERLETQLAQVTQELKANELRMKRAAAPTQADIKWQGQAGTLGSIMRSIGSNTNTSNPTVTTSKIIYFPQSDESASE
jgi:hypothetical protein